MNSLDDWLRAAKRDRVAGATQRSAVPLSAELRAAAVDLASNDYLGLAVDPRLKAAAVAAIEEYGCSARASPVVVGTLPVHRALEAGLCILTGRQSALVFSSGYLANLGALTALSGPGSLVLSDAHVHASLIDAARLSRARVQVFRHSDLAELENRLRQRSEVRAVVVVESVYSVLGDAAPLAELSQLCQAYDATLLVDEAHGLGVTGLGRGSVAAAGLAAARHVVSTVTLSKSLGAQGGAVLASAQIRDHLLNQARSFIFDTALAPAAAAAAAEACRIILAEPERVQQLFQVASALAAAAGVPQSAGAVQSLPVASAEQAQILAERLRAAAVLVGCFRPPSVPDGISRLRFTARATVQPEAAAAAAAMAARWARQEGAA
ncbi:aminotransferase class I/II-fold pyridoxal phosphate-dependent enzyme [Arthrobacter russicus]|uniref:8-amino-7-oxononanoate synthase n=1 Tax=Arthrobacter russicus TaxID=172040 RepID=A0ABU1JE33_9MICC|nr:aminotransferase class I/II-fold pyridoxal phosphate-dependent enzyme [Arthrobacter russicus]MDR6270702.1 8-amino-7-oxononanoate synthase [Arthrobacter russicus]